MPLPKSRAAYQDCYDHYDRAIADPAGIRIFCGPYKDAHRLTERLNYARILDRKRNEEVYDINDPQYGISVYDPFKNSIKEAAEGDGYWVYIVPYSSHGLHVESLSEDENVDQQTS